VDPPVSENKGMHTIGMQAVDIGAQKAVVACGNAGMRDPRDSDTAESRRACELRQRRRNWATRTGVSWAETRDFGSW
jgi:hypothetical protein